jgi:hypothetical protein
MQNTIEGMGGAIEGIQPSTGRMREITEGIQMAIEWMRGASE